MLPAVRYAYANLAIMTSGALAPVRNNRDEPYTDGIDQHYASGTSNTAPGFALAGENGPELVYFNGGEKVLNAAQTSTLQAKSAPNVSAMLETDSGSSSSPTVQVIIQVSGGIV